MLKHIDCLKAKNRLAKEILQMIKYKPDKSIYSDGVFTKVETFAVHQFIKQAVKKGSHGRDKKINN